MLKRTDLSGCGLPWLWLFTKWHYENIELPHYKNYFKENKMKVSVKKKVVKEKAIDWRTLNAGTVVEFDDKAVGLVYEGKDGAKHILLVLGYGGCNYPPENMYEGCKVTKVLGKMIEIIVEGL